MYYFLTEALKWKFIGELRNYWAKIPRYEGLVDCILGKYSFDVRPQYCMVVKTGSAEKIQFSPDNFQANVSSYVGAANIIDMIVITNSYYTDMINWKSNNGSLLTLPVAPTTEDLRVQFQDLDQYKMLSDAMVWNSGKFKLLFGPQAATELQATFMVIKAPATNTTDYEVKTGVIQAIDTYFDIRNWDFGEQFYYTELAAFIHQQLSTVISSVVIVPANASQFGNLFEITSAPQEIFMSTATVNNVQIVTNYTNQI